MRALTDRKYSAPCNHFLCPGVIAVVAAYCWLSPPLGRRVNYGAILVLSLYGPMSVGEHGL